MVSSKVKVKTVSEQGVEIYKLLEACESMTAKEISCKLDILPNAVYRVIDRLESLGMVRVIKGYPRTFQAVPSGSALNWYLLAASQSFKQEFGGMQAAGKKPDPSVPSITFIKNRQQLLEISALDIRSAKHSINYIVSGHRVPDSSVLAFRKAATKNVRCRVIIQNTPKTTNNPLENYLDLGMEVKYLPNIGMRLFVFDSQTAIMTSYDETQSARAFGIRFTYAPVAAQLDQLFEQNWQLAKEL